MKFFNAILQRPLGFCLSLGLVTSGYLIFVLAGSHYDYYYTRVQWPGPVFKVGIFILWLRIAIMMHVVNTLRYKELYSQMVNWTIHWLFLGYSQTYINLM